MISLVIWSFTLALIPLGGGDRRMLPLHGSSYRWRDAKQVSFVRASNLFVQPLAGGNLRKLTNFDDGTVPAYAWSPDGKRAIVAHMVQAMDVVLIQRK